jgi:hypothetical protein
MAASLAIPVLVVAGPLAVLLSIVGTYYFLGSSLLGPGLIIVWSLLTICFVFVLEKRGYARNFDGWDFPLGKRVLALPIAGVALITVIYLLLYIVK